MATSRKWLLAARHSSITPFLYQTRTLAAPTLRTSYSTTADGLDEETSNPSSTSPSSTTTSTERAPRPSFLQKHAASRLSSSRDASKKRKVAMTRSERKAFGELLGELQKSEPYPAFAASQGLKKKPESGNSRGDEMSQLSEIFESVLAEVRGKDKRGGERRQLRRRSVHAEEEGDEEDEMWAEMTLGEGGETVVDISAILGEEGKQVPMQRAVRIIVKREAKKIENMLREAVSDDKGDIGIWDVCKARIFSMLEHIGPNTVSGQRKRHSQQEQEQPTLEIPPSVPVEPVVVSLYPKMLLVAFRLLNQHYPKSQLIGQFRSTIKSHGRASAVLGTSTGLYNELITFYWQGMNDLAGVTSLLQEMEVIGVDANERTCHILKEILRQRDRDLKEHWYRRRQVEEGGKVRTREPWWDMAPNRRAVRDLLGPEGWVSRLEARVQKRRSV
ncbi:uncharacterized protein ACHE_10430A [Aspergillus chevalieri]|uniref:Mtf2-like C-terminal domain-containing protein n=1 Tax=Aspergillus chevalieri TaxID=182096 RepID=A0A7R7ZI92_ASPCH|nr:uncharacterized protein ACHE_10430A [Aspergillus chevalieri]BCR83028.1 hypothetical protein ACHE_10430A [Aspergillus chevalieri]